MTPHPLLPALRAVCGLLEDAGIHHVLSGGTLLGAVRDGTLIAHDGDIDVECLRDDLDHILALRPRFAEAGIELRAKRRRGVRLDDGTRPDEPVCHASNLHLRMDGRHIGDLLLFTVFDDGIARRYDPDSATLYNPRMQLPWWFLDTERTATIDGTPFRVPRDPEVVLENMYGPGWVRPIAAGDFPSGQNPGSGAVYDRPSEDLVVHALAHGWDGTAPPGAPAWPQPVIYVNSHAARRWVFRHEPELLAGGPQLLTDERLAALRAEPDPVRHRAQVRDLVVRSVRVGSDGARYLNREDQARRDAREAQLQTRIEQLERQLARRDARIVHLEETREQLWAKLRALRRRPVRTVGRYAWSTLRSRSS